MESHFLFEGPASERERARARVARALAKDAANPNHSTRYSAIPDLDAFLVGHFVRVTPKGASLHVELNPAVDPLWEMSFDVGADDTATNIVVGEIEPPPR